MPDIKTIQDDIRTRLAEIETLIAPLRAEAEQLSKLAATFEGANASPAAPAGAPARSRSRTPRKTTARAARPAVSKSPAKRGRPVGGGSRAAQALEQIAKQPGITASQLAAAMGIGPNYLYRVLPQLQGEGKIIKQGKGYHAAGAAGQATHTNGQGVTA